MQKLISHTKNKNKNEIFSNKKEIEKKIAEEEFKKFIEEKIKNNISWEEFERKFCGEKIFLNENLTKNKQMEIFKDYNFAMNENKKNLLRELFKEKIGLNQDITWHEVQHLLQNDQRFKNVIEKDRELLFNEYKIYVQETVLSEFHLSLEGNEFISKDSPIEGNGFNQLISKLNSDIRFQRLQRNPDKRDKFLRAKIKSLKYEFEKKERNARKNFVYQNQSRDKDIDKKGFGFESYNNKYDNHRERDKDYHRGKDRDNYRERDKERERDRDREYNEKNYK
jgi:hypothetical protein